MRDNNKGRYSQGSRPTPTDGEPVEDSATQLLICETLSLAIIGIMNVLNFVVIANIIDIGTTNGCFEF